MKQRILGPVIALVVILASTACGSAKSPGNSNGGAESGKLVVWDWKSSDKNAQNFVAKAKSDFAKKHPNVTLEFVAQPFENYYTLLGAAIQAGKGPDVMLFNGGGQIRDRTNALLPLDQYVTQDKDRLAGWDAFSKDGKIYAAPITLQGHPIYYNKSIYTKAGLDPDKPPATWSAVMAAAKQLTDPAKRVHGFGFCAHQSEQSVFQFLPWLWQAGGAMDRLDQPEATAALQFWTDLVRGGFVSPDVINQQQSEVMSTFLAGNTAFAVGGPWELPRFASEAKFQWRVAPLPVKDDKNIQASSLGGFHFAIPKGAKHVDGAFMVIEQMLDAQIFRQGWNTGGILAPRSDVEVPDPNWPQAYKVFRTQMQSATQRGPHPQWASLSRPLQIAIQEALTGTKPPAEALAGAAAKLRPILAKTPL